MSHAKAGRGAVLRLAPDTDSPQQWVPRPFTADYAKHIRYALDAIREVERRTNRAFQGEALWRPLYEAERACVLALVELGEPPYE